MHKPLRFVVLVLLMLLAIVFSMKQLIEPDLWWQLRTGEWILQTGRIPHTDSFSYTYTHAPWLNIKWGYEVLIALLSRTFGVEMLLLLQIVCSCLLVYLLPKLTRILAPTAPQSLTYFFTGLALITIEYRITGRSESISHVLLLAVCAIGLSFRFRPSRNIWWIPLIMMCWGNLHEGYSIGLVTLMLFTGVTGLEAVFTHTQTRQQAFVYLRVFLVSLVALCVNPYHVQILLKPLDVAHQVYQNKYTSELSTFVQPFFWTKEAWITSSLIGFTVIVVLLRLVVTPSKETKWKQLNAIVPLPYIALLIAFSYIASTGHRNIVFATLVFVPVSVANCAWLCSFARIRINDTLLYSCTVVAVALVYTSVVTNRYYSFWNSIHRYGMEIPADATPTGAASFLETHHLEAKPVFSDYLSSSYLLWRLQPAFTTFIDLRDLEVFPEEHFNLFTRILTTPAAFDKADSQYHFQSVVLLTLPQMQTLHTHLYHHPLFHLAYVDAVSVVYVKNRVQVPAISYSRLPVATPSKWAYYTSKLFNPWYAPDSRVSADLDYPAADYFYSVSDWTLAKQYARTSVEQGLQPWKGLVLLGQIAYKEAMEDTSAQRTAKLDEATSHIKKALALNPDYAPALMDLGILAFQQQQFKSALNYLEKACDTEPENVQAHTAAAEVYKAMAGTANTPKHLEKAIQHFVKAEYLNPNNPEIILNLGFLYYRLNKCADAVPYLEQIVAFPDITDVQRNRAKEALQRCN